MIRPARAVVFWPPPCSWRSPPTSRAQSPPPARALLQRLRGRGGAGRGRASTRAQGLRRPDLEPDRGRGVPELPSPSLEDFTVRAAQAWRVGRSKLSNGAVLFVFVKDRKMASRDGLRPGRRAPGRDRAPHHRRAHHPRLPQQRLRGRPGGGHRRHDGGDARRIHGLARPPARISGGFGSSFFLILLVLFIVIAMSRSGRRGRTYGRGGYYGGGPWWWGGGGFGGGGFGGGSSGGGGWGGGGGFSGGGGSFGGGGASGSW